MKKWNGAELIALDLSATESGEYRWCWEGKTGIYVGNCWSGYKKVGEVTYGPQQPGQEETPIEVPTEEGRTGTPTDGLS
ncbi:hypothetical protein [Butyrivibrio sp. VCB2006]|uniref:hypothetical protein n=1 Tax=Butyrivibrio sp. VCB2006 TaxID=1280679 RepID=UPI00041F4A68|nr:hypothetical protein [Butyrivibrio sp. VCB2006]